MTTRKPISKSPSSGMPTPAKDWKKASQAGAALSVPSGNVALVKPVGMQFFLSEGLVPNSLMPIVLDALNTGKPPDMASDVFKDTDKIKDIIKMVDDICVFCVLEPKLTPAPTKADGQKDPTAERDPDLLYVDEVDLEDKMFIFQYVVGGTKNVESFRKQLESGMESLQSRQDLGSKTE